MKLTATLMMVLMVLCLAVPAMAKTIPHDEAQVSITFPDEWKMEANENLLTLTTADEEVGMSLMVLEEGQSDKVGEMMDKALEKELGEITWENDEGTEEKHNGMDAVYWRGTAKDNVFVLCWELTTPSGKPLLCYMAATKEMVDKHQKSIVAVIDSIQPLEGAQAPADEEEADEEDEGDDQ